MQDGLFGIGLDRGAQSFDVGFCAVDGNALERGLACAPIGCRIFDDGRIGGDEIGGFVVGGLVFPSVDLRGADAVKGADGVPCRDFFVSLCFVELF